MLASYLWNFVLFVFVGTAGSARRNIVETGGSSAFQNFIVERQLRSVTQPVPSGQDGSSGRLTICKGKSSDEYSHDYLRNDQPIDVRPAWGVFIELTFETTSVCGDGQICFLGGGKALTSNTKQETANLNENLNKQDVTSNSISFYASVRQKGVSGGINQEEKYFYTFRLFPSTSDGCITITGVKVSYDFCPGVTQNLAQYPDTPAGGTVSDTISSVAPCVDNAEYQVGETASLACSYGGVTTLHGQCVCSAAYTNNTGKTECIICPSGMFKSSAGNEDCKTCGKNRLFLSLPYRCQCNRGFNPPKDRENDDTSDCHSFPSAPQNVGTIEVTNTTVLLSWAEPQEKSSDVDGLFYDVDCKPPVLGGSECHNVVVDVDSTLRKATISNLIPFTNYRFDICSHNSVSVGSSVTTNCVLEKKVTTLEGIPSVVQEVTMTVDNCKARIDWKEPELKGSNTVTYTVLCVGFQPKAPTAALFNDVQLSVGTHQLNCSVHAQTSVGHGPSVTVGETVECKASTSGDSGGDNTTKIIVPVVVCSLLLVVIVAALAYLNHRKNQRKQERLLRTVQEEFSTLELYVTNRQHNPYVDHNMFSSDMMVRAFDPEVLEDPLYEAIPEGFNFDYPYNKLHIIKELGTGNFAVVWKAKASNICGYHGDSIVAVKVLKEDCDVADRSDFDSELELMREIGHHDNVVKLLGVCSEPLAMIVEYVAGGDLLMFLLKSRGYRSLQATDVPQATTAELSFLTEKQLLQFAREVAQGMDFLTSKGIVHRDLAARNVLVGRGNVCKVADLGLARKLNEDGLYRREKEAKLPVKWLPPESIFQGRSSVKSDVWAFGVVIWEIVTIGGVPYPNLKSRDIPKKLKEGYRMPKPEYCRDAIYDVMTMCWHEQEDMRPSFIQLIEMVRDLEEQSDVEYVNTQVYEDDQYLQLQDGDDEEDPEGIPSDQITIDIGDSDSGHGGSEVIESTAPYDV